MRETRRLQSERSRQLVSEVRGQRRIRRQSAMAGDVNMAMVYHRMRQRGPNISRELFWRRASHECGTPGCCINDLGNAYRERSPKEEGVEIIHDTPS